jgi:hypothetical protein
VKEASSTNSSHTPTKFGAYTTGAGTRLIYQQHHSFTTYHARQPKKVKVSEHNNYTTKTAAVPTAQKDST